MMGERRVMQEALFYSFSLERHVPEDHLLRRIDQVRRLAGDPGAPWGPIIAMTSWRPSIDPELMIRMLIVGYGFLRIRSRAPAVRGGPS